MLVNGLLGTDGGSNILDGNVEPCDLAVDEVLNAFFCGGSGLWLCLNSGISKGVETTKEDEAGLDGAKG